VFETQRGEVSEQGSVVEPLLRELLSSADPALLRAFEVDVEHQAPPAEPWSWDQPEAPAKVGGSPPPTASSDWAAPGVEREAGAGSVAADPGPEVAALTTSLEALLAQDPSSLPGPVALARSRALLQASEQLKVVALESLADVETRQLFTLDDSPTVTSWVDSLGVPGVDRRELALARRLRRVPQVRTELRDGRLSSRTAAVVTAAVAKARPFLDRPDGVIDGQPGEQVLAGVLVDGVCTLVAEQVGGAPDADERLGRLRKELTALLDSGSTQLARWEGALVVLARESDPSLLASGIALLVDALLPQEHARRAQRAEDDAGFDLYRKPDGSGWRCAGELSDLCGEMLSTVLTAAEATDPEAVDDTARQAAGGAAVDDDTLAPHDWPVDLPAPRSRRRQRHDALVRGLRALLDAGALGVRGKVAPHIAVTVGVDQLEGVPGSLPARTDHGGRLSLPTVRGLLCGSTFTRLVLDARRRVVEASHTQRTSTALERLVLKVQGGAVCSGAGCARGPATSHRLVPHHGSLFSRTGTTELADTVLLCAPHHDHDLHAQRRTLRLKDGRVLGPDGWLRP
jgi:hypothetical protein